MQRNHESHQADEGRGDDTEWSGVVRQHLGTSLLAHISLRRMLRPLRLSFRRSEKRSEIVVFAENAKAQRHHISTHPHSVTKAAKYLKDRRCNG